MKKGRKEERSKQGQTNNKAKQHSTPNAVTFPKKNELPRTVSYVMYRAMHCALIKVALGNAVCCLRSLSEFNFDRTSCKKEYNVLGIVNVLGIRY